MLALVLISLLTLLVFWRGLSNGFIYDDFFLLVGNVTVRSLHPSNIVKILTCSVNETYRPLRVLAYAIGFRLWDMNATGFHVMSLAMHLVNVFLVCLLVRKITGDRLAGVVAAALFAVHPVHVESVSWVSGLKDVQGTLFLLLSFLCWPALHRRSRPFLSVVSVIAFALALLTKEGMIVMVGLVFVYEFLFARSPAHRVEKVVRSIAPYLVVSIAFVLVYFSLAKTSLGSRPGEGFSSILLLMVKAYAYYIYLFFFPLRLCSDHSMFPAPASILAPSALVSIVVLAAMAGLVIGYRRRAPWASFFVLWMFISLAPVSNIIPLGVRLAERYLYLPSVGWCGLLGGLIASGLRQSGRKSTRDALALLVGAALLLMSVVTIIRTDVWKNEFNLRSDMIRTYPHNPFAHNWLGFHYWKKAQADGGECEAYRRLSEAEYRLSMALRPGWPRPLIGLALLLEGRGLLDKADELFSVAAKLAVNDAMPWQIHVERGNFHMRTGECSKASADYEVALQSNSKYATTWFALGRAYLLSKEYEKATEAFQRALQLQPGYLAPVAELGNSYLMAKRFDDAEATYERYLRSRPDDHQIACNLALVYELKGDVSAALGLYDELLERPDVATDPEKKDGISVRRELLLSQMQVKQGRASYELFMKIGQLCERLGGYEEAIKAYQSAQQLRPDSVDAACLLGGAYLMVGKAEEAEERLRYAVKAAPERADAWFGLACVCAARGEGKSSLVFLRRAVGLGGERYRALGASSRFFEAVKDDPDVKAFLRPQQ